MVVFKHSYLVLLNCSIPATEILSGDNWRLHPYWLYCKYHDNHKKFCSQEDSIKHFLGLKGSEDIFKWGKQSVELPECKNYDSRTRWNFPDHCENPKTRQTPYYCKQKMILFIPASVSVII